MNCGVSGCGIVCCRGIAKIKKWPVRFRCISPTTPTRYGRSRSDRISRSCMSVCPVVLGDRTVYVVELFIPTNRNLATYYTTGRCIVGDGTCLHIVYIKISSCACAVKIIQNTIRDTDITPVVQDTTRCVFCGNGIHLGGLVKIGRASCRERLEMW